MDKSQISDKIPQYLINKDNWICWKKKERKNNQGKTQIAKVPCSPGGQPVSATNPENWMSYEDAEKSRMKPSVDGIGYCFSPEDTVTGIDLDDCRDSSTGEIDDWARGGINSALGNIDENDSWKVHAVDTLEEGHFINDVEAVEVMTKNMPDTIEELDDWGMDFTKTEDGQINQRYFGAQSYPRTCFAGDHTGESLLDTLVDKAQELGISYMDNVMITTLLHEDKTVYGAAGYNMETGEFIEFISEFTVLAAGGSTAAYNRHSSRENENNADGVALAYDAGAELMDMEFVQFHPTGMVGYGEEWAGRLVTEAVRGDGGYLINSEGERFMFEYSDLDRPELDARDVVARAIQTEISEGRGTENGGVYLDISHKDEQYIQERLPRMYSRFKSVGVDISEGPMEVAPTAHYSMGGVHFDPQTGKCGVDGLRVVGETTAGVHGANRLGGNSLAETVSIGKLVGKDIAEQEPATPEQLPDGVNSQEEFKRLNNKLNLSGKEEVMDLVETLGSVLEEHAGIQRKEESLTEGLNKIQQIENRMDDLHIQDDMTSVEFEFAIDLEFMITAAKCTILGSKERRESRGAHYRTDFETKREEESSNILYYKQNESIHTRRRETNEPSPEIKRELKENHEMDYHHLE